VADQFQVGRQAGPDHFGPTRGNARHAVIQNKPDAVGAEAAGDVTIDQAKANDALLTTLLIHLVRLKAVSCNRWCVGGVGCCAYTTAMMCA
jgi:hypothetical protein